MLPSFRLGLCLLICTMGANDARAGTKESNTVQVCGVTGESMNSDEFRQSSGVRPNSDFRCRFQGFGILRFIPPSSELVLGYDVQLAILRSLLAGSALLLFSLPFERRAHRRGQRRIDLEQEISGLSAQLVACCPEQIGTNISGCLNRLSALLDADSCCWYELQEGDYRLKIIFSASGPNVWDGPAVTSNGEWLTRRLLDGMPICIDTLDDLPSAASYERDLFETTNLKSLVLVPSLAGPSAKGVLGIAWFRHGTDATSELTMQLSVLGGIIASAAQREKAQTASQESENRFVRIFEEAPLGIVLEDLEGHLLNANPEFCSIVGYSQDELSHLTCKNMSHPEDLADEAILFDELLNRNRQSYQMDKRFFRKDGALFWAHVSVSLVERTGAPPLVIGMLKDISQRKADENKLAGASLELQRLTGRLIQAQDDERQRISRELHDDIAQRVSLLTMDLDVLCQELTSSGMEAGSRRASELHRVAEELGTDIHNLSHELHSSKLQHLGLAVALKDLRRRVSANNAIVVTLETDGLEKALPYEIALCLFRVAQEAINNASKHSHSTQLAIEVIQSSDRISLKVTDTGIGFNPAECSWGVGLSSMRERLRMLGSELVIRSAPEQGTEISATVKLMPEATSAAASA